MARMWIGLAVATLALCGAPSGVMAQTCEENEILVQSATACPRNCDNRDPVCDLQQVAAAGPACECKPGFLRNLKNGQCVATADCPSRGPRLECTTGCRSDGDGKRLNCKPGGKCTNVCDPDHRLLRLSDVVNTPYCASDDNSVAFTTCPVQTCIPQQCMKPNEEFIDCGRNETSCDSTKPIVEACHAACMCMEGFSRDHFGNCVQECPVCEKEEVLGNTCEQTCGNRVIIPGQVCAEKCVCDIASGYVRDEQTGKCIKEDECPLICEQNQMEGERCGDAPEKTCANVGADLVVGATEGCSRACVCVPGYVRNKNGACIKEEECPLMCGPNEVEGALCANIQERTCATLDGNIFTQQDNSDCSKACVCQNGFVRQDGAGPCIREDECCECPVPTACPQGFLSVKLESVQTNTVCPACETSICIPKYIEDGEECVLDEPRQCRSGSTCLQSLFGQDYGVCGKMHWRLANARLHQRSDCASVHECYLRCEKDDECRAWEYEHRGERWGTCRLAGSFNEGSPYYKVVLSWDLFRLLGFSVRALKQISTYRFTSAIKA